MWLLLYLVFADTFRDNLTPDDHCNSENDFFLEDGGEIAVFFVLIIVKSYHNLREQPWKNLEPELLVKDKKKEHQRKMMARTECGLALKRFGFQSGLFFFYFLSHKHPAGARLNMEHRNA